MVIQCPKCQARYRVRTAVETASRLQVTCPKCGHGFLVDPTQVAGSEASDKPKILIVDDARFFRELVLDLLADRKAELHTADSGSEAWEKLNKIRYGLLIIDINLPDISGLELIARLRDDQQLKGLPILCISGVYHKEDDGLKAIRAGADDFISKSFQPDEFNRRVDKLLSQ